MAQTKLRWFRRLVKAALWTMAVLLVLYMVFPFWPGPALVRWQINRRLAGCWDGTAAIDGVDVSLVGRTVSMGGFVLCDRQGRAWLRAAGLTVSVDELLSSRPVVRSLRAYNAEVIVHCDDGICRPPLLSTTSDDWADLLGVDGVVVDGATLTIRNNGGIINQTGVPLVSYRRKAGQGSWVGMLNSVGTFEFTDLQATGFVAGEDSIELGRLTGKLGGGRIIVTGRADRDPNGQWRATGRVVATRVNLRQLKLRVSGGGEGIVTGMADLRLALPDPNGLAGKGVVFIQGADLSGVAPAKALLKSAGLKKSEMLTNADGEGLFHLHGTTFTFDQARLSLPLAAVDIEPGAKINVATGQLDAVAVVVLFEQVRDMIKSLPLIGLMVDLTERFSRLRVRGFWQDDESIQITPAATRNVTSQTRQFLTDAARGRKRLGRGVLDALGMPNGNSTPTSRPASGPATRGATDPADKPGK